MTPDDRSDALGAGLAWAVALIAALLAASSATRPVPEGRPGAVPLAIGTALLLVHAALYGTGGRIRGREPRGSGRRMALYLSAQGAALFAYGLLAPPSPVTLVLFGALTAHAIILLDGRVSAMPVTLAAIVIFGVNATLTSDVYRGASIALALATVGVVIRVVTGAARVTSAGAVGAEPAASYRDGGDVARPEALAGPDAVDAPGGRAADVRGGDRMADPLTARELEVLGLAADGKRSREIAALLDISERTVKAHLAASYRKLGVETRAAAAAVAERSGLLRGRGTGAGK